MKKCHNCFRLQPMTNYRPYQSSDDWTGRPLRANTCKKCEDKGFKDKNRTEYDALPGVNTIRDDNHVFGFIGNLPYKKVCKIFKIRYEGDR